MWYADSFLIETSCLSTDVRVIHKNTWDRWCVPNELLFMWCGCIQVSKHNLLISDDGYISKCHTRPKCRDVKYVQMSTRPSFTIHDQLLVLHMASQLHQIYTLSVNSNTPTFSTPKCVTHHLRYNEFSEFDLTKSTHLVRTSFLRLILTIVCFIFDNLQK